MYSPIRSNVYILMSARPCTGPMVAITRPGAVRRDLQDGTRECSAGTTRGGAGAGVIAPAMNSPGRAGKYVQ